MKRLLLIFLLISQVVFGQTMLYTSSTTAPAISPAFAPSSTASWFTTTNAVRRTMSTTKDGSAMTNTSASGTVTSGNSGVNVQFIAGPLAAQTILNSGYMKFQMRGLSSVATNGLLVVSLRVVTSTGTTRGWLVEFATPSGTGYTTSLRNTGTAGSSSLVYSGFQASPANVSVSAGDYLVLEVGGFSSSGSRTFTQSIGSSAGVDLAQDNTTTTANDPWLFMSQTITFSAPPPSTNNGMPLSILMN